jgi:hypothetical protein
MQAMDALAGAETFEAGADVLVETSFGTYRGLLAQGYVKGAHVRLRCLGHDMWLHNWSVYGVRAAGQI